VSLLLGVHASEYEPGSRVLTLEGGASVEAVDAVLVAVGRQPVLDAVEDVVDADDAGIRVDAWGRTSAPGIWAVGDVTPATHQTHGADVDARRVIQAIAFPWVPRIGRPPTVPTAVFSDPEVAWVGPTRHERGDTPHPSAVVRVRVELSDTDRGLTDGIRHGFVAIDAVRLSGRVLHATLVGPRVSELLPLLTHAVARRMSLLRLSRAVYAYPTLSGAIGRAADDFAVGTLTHPGREVAAYARYRVARAFLPRRAAPGRRARVR
jgi:mycothione reductase